jgi:ribosomal protein S18 acetylase RimI-like enzyme
MDDAALAAIEQRALADFYRALGTHAPGGSVLEPAPGVVAAVVPERPERSLLNAAVAADERALLTARAELARAYEDAGVNAWAVWTRPGDDAAAAALAAAGHLLDSEPVLMAASIDELDLEPRMALDLEPGAGIATALEVNDRAYGLRPGDGLGGSLGSVPPGWRTYVARVDGAPASCAIAIAEHGNCELTLVATVPSARGRGLAAELMRQALREARSDGAATTTLEASAMGEPVYARMGYRSLGRLGLWELRRPASDR